MKTRAVYHWWAEECDSPPYSNIRAPILMSIATLRAVNQEMPITVLDMTFHDKLTTRSRHDWAYFPEKLNFEVMYRPFYFEKHKDRIRGWKHLSRIKDIDWLSHGGHNYSVLMYVDSDVFWIRDPLPLGADPSKFCSNGWNTGFFYYNSYYKNHEFFELLDAYTTAAIYSPHIRETFKKHVGYDAWYDVWDEMTISYISHHHPELVNIIPPEEHLTLRQLDHINLSHAKMLHANGIIMKNPLGKTGLPDHWGEQVNSRGLLVLLLKELYDNIMKVLNEDDLKMMFTTNELAHYRDQQFSLIENKDRLLATKTDDGHFDIQKCLHPVSLI
jgi:hypothetical protein